MTEELTSQTEEFLETIYRLQERDGVARTSELVKMLHVVPGTVTNTVERLEKRGLIRHTAYRGVKLTDEGKVIALRVLRRHRLSERLLSDVLKMEWNQIHEAACQLEHGVTEEVVRNIEKHLEQPTTCPHGNPIPTIDGEIFEETTVPLSTLNPGTEGTVKRITDESPKTLENAAKIGLKPGVHVKVVKKSTRKGTLTIQADGSSQKITLKVAAVIHIKTELKNGSVRQEVKEWSPKKAN
ncbi:MAG: metal-dependent transcriptional regulator [Candidatus Bathyarchaeia archaeon]|nr:metal-dependent transcriptional regulator [Candidatus Bathyarchaeota archaeon]